MTTTRNPVRPSKPHLADAIALRRGVQVTDLHLTLLREAGCFQVTGEGYDRRGRRIRLAGTVPPGRRTLLDNLDLIPDGGRA